MLLILLMSLQLTLTFSVEHIVSSKSDGRSGHALDNTGSSRLSNLLAVKVKLMEAFSADFAELSNKINWA